MGHKCVELITEPGFVLREKKPWQARHNVGCYFRGLVKGGEGVSVFFGVWEEYLVEIVGNSPCHK